MINTPICDPFIPVAQVSAALRDFTGDPGPGHRQLVDKANNAQIAPPMERRGRFWGCRESRLPELATLLSLQVNDLGGRAASVDEERQHQTNCQSGAFRHRARDRHGAVVVRQQVTA
jgi:hypothetical protein